MYFKSNGKLLLTNEYVVLDGAKALAIPTAYGQSLTVTPNTTETIIWESYDHNQSLWLRETFTYKDIVVKTQLHGTGSRERLLQIFHAARCLNADFLTIPKGLTISTHLDFPKHWGLGTSSTLINNVAQWANVDAYALLAKTFGGSGYDIACAKHNTPIIYQIVNEKPSVQHVNFKPMFHGHLFFVYLNKKQNSRDGIAHYLANKGKNLNALIAELNTITEAMVNCCVLEEFKNLMDQHECIIANITSQNTVKAALFNDFEGSIKSLGAWGGDFILVASNENPTSYFSNKGFNTIIPFAKMVRQ